MKIRMFSKLKLVVPTVALLMLSQLGALGQGTFGGSGGSGSASGSAYQWTRDPSTYTPVSLNSGVSEITPKVLSIKNSNFVYVSTQVISSPPTKLSGVFATQLRIYKMDTLTGALNTASPLNEQNVPGGVSVFDGFSGAPPGRNFTLKEISITGAKLYALCWLRPTGNSFEIVLNTFDDNGFVIDANGNPVREIIVDQDVSAISFPTIVSTKIRKQGTIIYVPEDAIVISYISKDLKSVSHKVYKLTIGQIKGKLPSVDFVESITEKAPQSMVGPLLYHSSTNINGFAGTYSAASWNLYDDMNGMTGTLYFSFFEFYSGTKTTIVTLMQKVTGGINITNIFERDPLNFDCVSDNAFSWAIGNGGSLYPEVIFETIDPAGSLPNQIVIQGLNISYNPASTPPVTQSQPYYGSPENAIVPTTSGNIDRLRSVMISTLQQTDFFIFYTQNGELRFNKANITKTTKAPFSASIPTILVQEYLISKSMKSIGDHSIIIDSTNSPYFIWHGESSISGEWELNVERLDSSSPNPSSVWGGSVLAATSGSTLGKVFTGLTTQHFSVSSPQSSQGVLFMWSGFPMPATGNTAIFGNAVDDAGFLGIKIPPPSSVSNLSSVMNYSSGKPAVSLSWVHNRINTNYYTIDYGNPVVSQQTTKTNILIDSLDELTSYTFKVSAVGPHQSGPTRNTNLKTDFYPPLNPRVISAAPNTVTGNLEVELEIDNFSQMALTLEVEKNEGQLFVPLFSISVKPSGNTSLANIVSITDVLDDPTKKVQYRFRFQDATSAYSAYSIILEVDPASFPQSPNPSSAPGISGPGLGGAGGNFIPSPEFASISRDKKCFVATATTHGYIRGRRGISVLNSLIRFKNKFLRNNSVGNSCYNIYLNTSQRGASLIAGQGYGISPDLRLTTYLAVALILTMLLYARFCMRE